MAKAYQATQAESNRRGSLGHVEKARAARDERGQTRVGILVAWLLAGTLLAALALASARFFPVDEVTLPDFTGVTLEEAQRSASAAGVTIRSYPSNAPGVEANIVVEQSPPSDTVVKRGRTVALGVNQPSDAVRMPDLVGLAERDALDVLTGLDLPAPDLAYVDGAGDVPAGRIARQMPEAGAVVEPGGDLALDVARAAAPFSLELPSVMGLPVDQARARLEAAGFRRVETMAMEVSTRRPGTVTQQRPNPGTVMQAGEPVTLGYALGGIEVARVPNLRGATLAEAGAALRTAGLTVGPIVTVDRADAPRGVIDTRPSGVTVPGAPVTLVVNTAQAAPETDARVAAILDALGDSTPIRFEGGAEPDDGEATVDAATEIDVPDDDEVQEPVDFLSDLTLDGASVDGTPVDEAGRRSVPFAFDPGRLGVASLLRSDYALRLVVRDDEGERVALEGIVPAGEAVFANVGVQGSDALLQTFVNDIFFQAWHP